MKSNVEIVIELPNKVFLSTEASGVIIPSKKGDVMILSEKAPNVFILDLGSVQLLDVSSNVVEKYYIASGSADIASGKLKILTPMALSAKDMTLDKAKALVDGAKNEFHKLFYQMIVDDLRGVRRGYLRKLRVLTRRPSDYPQNTAV